MQKLRSLHTHLASKNVFDENQLESWAEKSTVSPSGKRVTIGLDDMVGVQLGLITYDAVFVVENYAGLAETIIAQVLTWLMDYDPFRDRDGMGDPVFEVDPHDNGRVDLEIRIPFEESLNLVLDESGTIAFNGQLWRVETSVVYEAETANLVPVNSNGDPV